MEEGGKRVLATVAGIFMARHLKNTEELHDCRSSPRAESLIESAVQLADRIMRRIDGTFGDSNADRRGHVRKHAVTRLMYNGRNLAENR